MKNAKRIVAFVLTLVMLSCSWAFAGSSSIISPGESSIITSDSLLVSVKFTEEVTAKITVYQQVIKETEIVTSGSAVDGTLTTYEAISYKSIDTTDYEAENLASVSAIEGITSRIYVPTDEYTNTENIGFYTKQLTSVKPGVYKIVVKTYDEKGKVLETSSRLFAVKEKVQEETLVFETRQASPLKLITNLLKSIFK